MRRRGSSSQLDYVLVPLGLAVMLGYHLWLLLHIRRRPETTAIGINTINRRIWVRHIMEQSREISPSHAPLQQYRRQSTRASAMRRRGLSSSQLDYVLVPLGLAVMLGYHLWLLLRIRRRPETTVIGINAINRRIWVRHIMEEPSGKHAVLAVQTMRNSIMASTVLASVAITLSSLVVALVASGAAHGLFSGSGGGLVVFGSGGEAVLTLKFFAILVCFLVAFLLNVQSIRYYSHTGLLVNVPLAAHRRPASAVGYVTGTLNRGFYFWSLGVRAYYFSCPVFLWLFGPVPMCASCVAMVAGLYFLDVYKEWDKDGEDGHGDDGDGDGHGHGRERKMSASGRLMPVEGV
nr:unnamed protein product [Digitaria exilis]